MKIASNKIKDVIRFFKSELQNCYTASEIDIFINYCFEDFLNIKRIDLTSKAEETISESDLLKFNFAVKDLKNEKPIQYILGKADFYKLKFIVNENVLIPRPETEELVHLIISENKKSTIEILDIGTGSGCIPISLKKNIPSSKLYAIDISEQALKIAKQNAELNNVEIKFVLDDILNPQNNHFAYQQFDIIVSNPPYVCISEKAQMQKNVLDFEPHLALFVNDSNPLLFYNAIADFAFNHLKSNGKLYFEINENLGEETKELITKKGFKNVELLKDLSNKNRILRSTI